VKGLYRHPARVSTCPRGSSGSRSGCLARRLSPAHRGGPDPDPERVPHGGDPGIHAKTAQAQAQALDVGLRLHHFCAASDQHAPPGPGLLAQAGLDRELGPVTAKTADVLPSGVRMTGRAAARPDRPRSVTSHLRRIIWARCRVARLLAPGSAGRQRRAPAPLRRSPLPGPPGGLPGRPLLAGIVGSGPGSPLLNVPAVRLFRLSGVAPGLLPGGASGPAAGLGRHVASRRGGPR
jgi:hypothetical protein